MSEAEEQAKLAREIDQAINKLNNRGIKMDSVPDDTTGLGDVMETILSNMGITEERYKQWRGLKECGCSRRKKWLNKMFSWKKRG